MRRKKKKQSVYISSLLQQFQLNNDKAAASNLLEKCLTAITPNKALSLTWLEGTVINS